jgi:phosphoglucosamine mutase
LARQLFGTDGIRGVAGEPPIDRATAFALGLALAEWTKRRQGAATPNGILIGIDTRESGPWLAEYVAGGVQQGGIPVRFAGVSTTPGIAYLTRTKGFAAGVMISASHNPYHDNGLKVIGNSGYKLPDTSELELEQAMNAWHSENAEPVPARLSADSELDHLYTQYLAGTVSGTFPIRLAVDCANGSAVAVAPHLFPALVSDVSWLAANPDGRNINLNSGSLYMDALREYVQESGADLGVAFDGDADRALFVSRTGRMIDGDAILFVVATALKRAGKLRENVVVATVMSNLGLEKALSAEGIELIRTPVGDKYVLEEMLKRGAALGGEQSGHIIFPEYATTGDGILTALRLLEIVRSSGQTIDELVSPMRVYPQKLVNVRVGVRRSLTELVAVQAEIRAAEQEFGEAGRVLVRFSGTEPLARVMIEGSTLDQVDKWTGRIAAAIRAELGSPS